MTKIRSNIRNIAKQLSDIMKSDYSFYNSYSLSQIAKINWKTVNNFFIVLKNMDILEKKDKKYRWGVVPLKFFNEYKEEKETYIKSLEIRLFQLQQTNINIYKNLKK